MKYNLQHIMLKAWQIYRKTGLDFGECLHRAWLSEKAQDTNAQRIQEAKAAAGVTEECRTWSEWKKAGFMVVHGSKALFKAVLVWGSRGDGATYTGAFFGRSQVEAA